MPTQSRISSPESLNSSFTLGTTTPKCKPSWSIMPTTERPAASAPNHARIPILYVILGVLLVISIVPMYFYSAQVEAINRDRLKTNEMLLQNTVTRSLADDLAQHERSLHMMLANLSSAIQIASGGDIGEAKNQLPSHPALREDVVSS